MRSRFLSIAAAALVICTAYGAGKEDASSTYEMKLFQKSTAYFFVPIADLVHDSSLSNYLRAPKIFNKFGIEVTADEVKFVSHWNIDLVLQHVNNISNIVSVSAQDNFISWNPRHSRLGIGLQTFAWGKADGLNPTAVVNPMDYQMPTDLKKVPALSASYTAYPAPWLSIDVVYLPFKQESLLPYSIAEKIPRSVFNKYTATSLSFYITNFDMGTGSVGMTSQRTLAETVMTNDIENKQFNFDLNNPVGALRANFFSGPIDFSFMYAYDIDQFYTTSLSLEQYAALTQAMVDAAVESAVDDAVARGVIPGAASAATKAGLKASIPKDVCRISAIDLTRARAHRFGADMKTTIGPCGVWAEVCYSLTEDPGNTSSRIRNPYFDWTAGFDLSYGPDDQWYINVQYTGCFVHNYDDRFYTDYAGGLPDPLQASNTSYMADYYYRAFTQKFGNQYEGLTHGIALKANWPLFNDALIPSVAASYFFPMIYDTKEKTRYGRGIVMPEVKWNINDALSLSLGANIYFAFKKDAGSSAIAIDRDDPIGMFYDDSSAYLRFTYAWNIVRQSE